MDCGESSDDEEVDGLSEECSSANVGSCVEEDDCECSLQIFALEAFEICSAFEGVVGLFFADGLDEVGEAGVYVVCFAVDAGHY